MLTGQYTDILRVIGRLLDEREALLRAEIAGAEGDAEDPGYEAVEIVEHDAFMRVSWRTSGGSAARQAYTELNLAKLRARSRQLRGETTTDPLGEREELFRTLGQELDAEDLQVSGVFENGEHIVVSGSEAGRYFNRTFRKEDLLHISAHRQQFRPVTWAAPDGEPEDEAVVASRSHWLLWGARPGR